MYSASNHLPYIVGAFSVSALILAGYCLWVMAQRRRLRMLQVAMNEED